MSVDHASNSRRGSVFVLEMQNQPICSVHGVTYRDTLQEVVIMVKKADLGGKGGLVAGNFSRY